MFDEPERACEPKEPQEYLDFKEIELTLQDADFIRLRGEIRTINCRCFAIPPETLP